jgi:uncharacterized membrane protein
MVSGLRSMLGLAAVSWAAHLGMLRLDGTSLALMNSHYARFILTALALGELIMDKMPFVPSRKSPFPFIGRMVTGALTGATVGASAHSLVGFALIGAVGAIAGTLGGSVMRGWVARLFGRDLPAALVEDLSALLIIAFCFIALHHS